MSTDTFEKFRQKQSRDGDRQCGKTDASKDGAALLGQHSQATGHGGGWFHTRDTSIQPMEAALNQATFLTQAQALLGKAIGEHTTQQNIEVKSIINKDRQVAPKRMPLGVRLAVITHNMGVRFVESVKNARCLMSPQEAGDGLGLESIVEFKVQIKGHKRQEYMGKWQGWQSWTDEKLATKLTKDDSAGQQPVLLLPARWWPDTLPEFESEGWWQRPQMRVKYRHCRCGFEENPSLGSNKCHEC